MCTVYRCRYHHIIRPLSIYYELINIRFCDWYNYMYIILLCVVFLCTTIFWNYKNESSTLRMVPGRKLGAVVNLGSQ